jgi:hypothetical protein
MVKAARRASWPLVERVPKTNPPRAAVFCHLFTGTETYVVNILLQSRDL